MQISQREYQNELDTFLSYLNFEKKKCFGIQMNQENQDCLDFAPFLEHTLNNLGDPFCGEGGHLETFKYERELVRIVSEILQLNAEDVWGYYTSGSSISNLQGVHLGLRKMGENTILVTSEDAHNSITKAAYITRVKQIVQLPTNNEGQIDPDALSEFLSNTDRSQNFVFCFCSGTVSKGAYDDVELLVSVIDQYITKEQYYVHLDAALGGMITPFLEGRPLKLDFSVPEIDSLSVSFHKRVGIPVPGSLFLMRRSSLMTCNANSYVEDYASFDTTIPGSRDGLTPFITLMKLKKIGIQGMVDRTENVLQKAKWFHERLLSYDIKSLRNDFSPCVYFEVSSPDMLKEFHMPTYRKSDGKIYTHIFTMEHVCQNELNNLLNKIVSYKKKDIPVLTVSK
ncbi:pyridoxal-dependent decarboxylase [Aquimarina sp. D1M17]|uniref:pyridoxal-dependent decarboxylase n=1 Tax=Aquimarina acroporae TaxID=2937283 RepID=UPI0020BD6700|nr:pyridoxal-dependent decarboxylase [Aquimarina acroporae]MCK8522356.1 pyridoxal-dependent decarboxylase [Aquimarina acroporae]